MSDGNGTDPEEEPELESWVRIQKNTFTNWVNDKLRIHDMEIENIRTDMKDGVSLCKLMEALKGKRIGKIIQKKNLNHYEASGNMQVAFNAMRQDGVRLVNIGAEDVRSGNVKLILGLMWTLIRFYQIGSQSRLPAKALMLSWCNAVLHPHVTVSNFSKDWNDGIALHGLIEYCQPGSCSSWYQMSRADVVGNCTNAMQLAFDLLGIPMVMRPEDMANPELDDLSAMTYLSYFMADGSPGFNATLNWVKSQISPEPVGNFDKDWNNGYILTCLVRSFGASVPNDDVVDWEETNSNAIQAAQTQLQIQPVLRAKDLINPDVDHIGVMAHAAWHEASLRTAVAKEPVAPEPVRIPTPPPLSPTIVHVTAVEEEAEPAPKVNVVIDDNWRIDGVMNVEIDTSNLGPGTITATAETPSGESQTPIISRLNENLYHLEFIPREKGSWYVHIKYDDNDVSGSPYNVNVYDPSSAKITRDYGVATQDQTYSFDVDVLQVGLDDMAVYIVHEGASVPHHTQRIGVGQHRVTFTPEERGTYSVVAYTGGVEVPGSPFDIVCKLVQGIQATGQGLTAGVVRHEAVFEIDTSVSPGRSLHVTVVDPNGQKLVHRIEQQSGGEQYNVHFTPVHSGEHTIEVLYDGVGISGSPFKTDIRKSKVYLQDISPYGFVGKPLKFKIDASEMKKGTLEIDSDIPVVAYDKLGQNTYRVTMLPKRAGVHDVIIKYNDQIVEGCPFDIDVKPSP